jgi:thioredoxin reductase (NADPH)
MKYDIIILGGGPAGLTAGIYASRGGLKALLIEKKMTGGLAASTDLLENYPGFPDGINGMELTGKMKAQAERFGVEIHEFEEVESVIPGSDSLQVATNKGKYESRTVIVGTGSVPKMLNVPGETQFTGRGVSYCATCDGPLFRDKEVVVVGCGNSGLQEGEFLLRFVKRVKFVEFLPHMTAEKILQDRLVNDERTDFLLNHQLVSINGDAMVNSVTVKDRNTGKEKQLETSGVFVYAGFLPNSGFLKGVVELDKAGYIISNKRMETSVSGLFAVGDIRADQV